MIGSEGEGNVFVGASLPFGMVKLGPDMVGHSNSGYRSDTEIEGFSHIHVSGTGGGAKYGNIMVTPSTDKIDLNVTQTWSIEEVTPGYLSVNLQDNKIKAELSTTHSAAFHRYTFSGNNANILFNAGHFLSVGEAYGEAQQLVGSEISIISPTEVEGYNRVRNGWNLGDVYTVYFYAIIDTDANNMGVWVDENMFPDRKTTVDKGKRTGAYFSYDTSVKKDLNVKVGISFISSNKAKANLEGEITTWNFYDVKNQAAAEWDKVLSKIKIEGGIELKTIFYTALYHSMLMPVDRTSENPKWRSEVPYYDDYYAIWDTFRTTNPLLLLISRERHIEMLQSLLEIYKYEGYAPDARSGNSNGRTQGGSNSDILFAEAFLKNVENIDYELALESMLKNATVPPGDNSQQEGRGGLFDYNRINYVSTDYERSCSRTLEYANCDFAIYTLAKALGENELAQEYYKKASHWKNLWREDFEDRNVIGFIYPKKSNGEWLKNYDFMEWGFWNVQFYEGRSWNYSFYVPHDVRGLVEMSGGSGPFIKRLDTFFDEGLYDVGNEPDFLTPTYYSYVGNYDLTAKRIRSIIRENFKATRDGLPGNDDSGAMSSWFLFHTMGFYPVAGQDIYLVTSPSIKRALIDLGKGKVLEIEVSNPSKENIYVKKMFIDGKTWNKCWFRHNDIKDGAKIIFEMSHKPTGWGNEQPPPSLSDGYDMN